MLPGVLYQPSVLERMVATGQQSSSTSSANTQTLESGVVTDNSSQNHTPTAVIVPIVIIAVALLIPIWLCLRRLRAPERVIPLYRQEESVEKPKLCEVALMGGGHGAPVTHSQPGWRRLRPLSIHQHWYQELQDSNLCCDKRKSRSLSPSSRRSSSRHSRTDSLGSMSQLRVGVLIAMPSPPLSGRKSPDDAVPMPDLCLGFKDVHFSGEPMK